MAANVPPATLPGRDIPGWNAVRTRYRRPMALLRDRRVALLVGGQAVNAIGSWCALVALWGYASFRFDAGPSAIALLGLAWALPALLLGPIAGVPVDRLGPKRALVVSDAAAAIVALTFIFAGSFPALVGLAAIDGVTKAFSEPAFRALAPRIVDDEHLAAANALLSTATQSAIAIGPLLGALAISSFGFEAAFVVDAMTYGVGLLVLIPFRIGAATPGGTAGSGGERPGVLGAAKDGIRIVRDRRDLRWLLLLAASVYLIWGGFVVVEPIYVREVLHGSPALFAWIESSFGIALFVAGLVVTRLGERVVRWPVVCAAAIASGATAMVYVGTANVVVAFVGIIGWGVVTAYFGAPLHTLMQRAAPVEAHGRVFALDGTVHSAGDLVALPTVGMVAGLVGIQVAAIGIAVVPIVGGALTWWCMRGNRPSRLGGGRADGVAVPVAA